MKNYLFLLLIIVACKQKPAEAYAEFKKSEDLIRYMNNEKIVDLTKEDANIIFLYPGFCGTCNTENVKNIQTKLKFKEPCYIIIANEDSVNILNKLSKLPNTKVYAKNEEKLSQNGLIMAEDVIVYYKEGKSLGYEPLAKYSDNH
jgi:hypothetical protein